jgi:hypothetical protein
MLLLSTQKYALKWDKYRSSQGWGIRIYRHEYPFNAPTKEFEALAVKFGRRIFWFFTQKALRSWPSCG